MHARPTTEPAAGITIVTIETPSLGDRSYIGLLGVRLATRIDGARLGAAFTVLVLTPRHLHRSPSRPAFV